MFSPLLANQFGILPAHGLIEHPAEIITNRYGDVGALPQMSRELRQREFLVREIAECPSRMQREARDTLEGKPERRSKSGLQVALPVSAGDRVDRQRQDIKIRGNATVDHLVRQAPILVEVELKELRRFDLGRDLLHADSSKRRDAEHGAKFLCGPPDRPLTVVMKNPLQRRRRAEERHAQLLAHNGRRHVDRFDATEDAGHEIALLVRQRVPAIGDLVVGRAIDIVKHRRRQSLPRQRAEIGHVVAAVD